MLTVEHLPEFGLYLVIPVIGRRECPDNEFLFSTESEALEFIDHYFQNPIAAMFAFEIKERMMM